MPLDPRMPMRMAVLEAQLSPDADGWCQLLPSDFFKARDGRPFDVEGGQWYLDQQTASVLIAKASAQSQDILIDYDHQTLKNGSERPTSPRCRLVLRIRDDVARWRWSVYQAALD